MSKLDKSTRLARILLGPDSLTHDVHHQPPLLPTATLSANPLARPRSRSDRRSNPANPAVITPLPIGILLTDLTTKCVVHLRASQHSPHHHQQQQQQQHNNNNNNHPSKANPANQTPPKTAQASTISTSPTTCPNIEIRHPSFNGAKCIRCTDAARAAAAAKGVTQEEKAQVEMVRKLEEEIARLEGVVTNMKRKLRSLTLAKETDGDDGEGETGEGLKDVLEGNLGSGWGGVL
ncbi:hypothetical protein EPUS_04498 [Endocarpon pusillum Z07020]|uniref:Uncharacterized protein n=1 Tax=Endocarpon pusillum (strain Z07020 / HMAS-L-300199) TaxID=1263415 RepID=U1GAW3_ENDPU|nr:uncharacterized protein EPUS_04498 [Endocarpon pusillum Z07020]ERF68846.1 hypothetical protein EPUS_04498 [Endocarpon pusillum Z07020]